MSPPANLEHQDISFLLTQLLRTKAIPAGLRVYQDAGVRLASGRVAIPDVVVIELTDRQTSMMDVRLVRLVAEIVSPGNAAVDRVKKMTYYAESAIPFYVLIERYPRLTLRLFQLKGPSYVERASAAQDGVLRLTDPFVIDLTPASLVDPSDWPLWTQLGLAPLVARMAVVNAWAMTV